MSTGFGLKNVSFLTDNTVMIQSSILQARLTLWDLVAIKTWMLESIYLVYCTAKKLQLLSGLLLGCGKH